MTLQNILGKNYKWWYIIKYSAKNGLTSIQMNILFLIASVLEVSAYLYLYFINKSINITEVVTYFMLARLYASLVMNRWYYFIGDMLYSSGLSRFLLVPTNYFLHHLLLSFGGRFVRNGLAILTNLMIITFLHIFVFRFNVDSTILLTLFLVPFGLFLNFVMCAIVGHIGFFIKDKRDFHGLCEIYFILFAIMSGTIIPLFLIPIKWLEYTPFAYVTFQPMRLYKNPSLDLFLEICFNTIVWTVILFLVYRIIFKVGMKRNEAVGL